jgi:hypothetical protein
LQHVFCATDVKANIGVALHPIQKWIFACHDAWTTAIVGVDRVGTDVGTGWPGLACLPTLKPSIAGRFRSDVLEQAQL